MAFSLPDLPFDPSDFGDVISAETFSFHHGKHHKTYVDKTNGMLKDAGLEGKSLVKVIEAAKETNNKALFNNAAQLWNHSFYWLCLSPEGGKPTGELKDRIEADFGSVDEMLAKLKDESVNHFASGWGWLVLDGDKLKIKSYHDADTPIVHGVHPLLTLDVWEHAYYVDYRNDRAKHIQTLLDRAINWDFVAQNLDGKGASRADQKG